MRTKFVAAILLAGGLFVASCNWFSSKLKTNAFNIEGKWTVDSIVAGKDSSATTGILARAVLQKDSVAVGIDFQPDSSYVEFPESTIGKGRYYVKDKELYLSHDSAFFPYNLNVVSDSLIHVSSLDSLLIILKRQ